MIPGAPIEQDHPQDAQVKALLDSAFYAFDDGRYPDARAACRGALALRPDSTAAHSLLGLICEKEGKTAEAIHQFQIVLELNPNSDADRQHLERLQRLSLTRVSALGGLRWRPSLAMAGGAAAVLVLGLGLWGLAGMLKSPTSRQTQVRPTNLRVMRGAPGTVSPGASSFRLPAPVSAPNVAMGRQYTMTPRSPYGAATGVGGIPTTVQTNARMAQLAPRLYGTTYMPPVQTPGRAAAPRRQASLAPAPVRMPRLDAVPSPGGPSAEPQAEPVSRSRFGAVPQLPDARGLGDSSSAEEGQGNPSSGSGQGTAAAPPVLPTPAGGAGEETGGSSYIRIRPVTEVDRPNGSPGSPAAEADDRRSRSSRGGSSVDAGSAGPTLAEARLHQQNGFNYWRQGDYAAAAQEYEYAAQLFSQIAARRGPDAAAAAAGLRASQQGLQASRGRR
jgi:hypothetical protein